ncbi:uncharacterized protein M421DRAFT_93438 [Didymella exigua CBS 183.55]|uniref:Uncharacterized protein n=1 Tax=Didymella exigua CBS 183.55 TaxID=1150837 RepID=A0A6A5RI71_9PLEO|nr:uncharacterized protein M421DRAFT_93438 [Didymella exigua CBS 183.55]KAF1927193.1 hypothetical protein M421DRAFT_93438 [Didymella exigua CBS 183.55]
MLSWLSCLPAERGLPILLPPKADPKITNTPSRATLASTVVSLQSRISLHYNTNIAMSTLLAIPRELREGILHYLTLPPTVFESSARTEKVKMATSGGANNTKATELSDTELDEAVERSGDDGMTLRLTLEVQRQRRNAFGFFIPVREDLSPRFLALLPLMKDARKLKIVLWPGFDWWNGPPQASPLELWRQRKALLNQPNTEQLSEADSIGSRNTGSKPDDVTVAVGKILDQLPAVEELDLSILIATSDLFGWDLPDVKWEKIQPWLDAPISKTIKKDLRSVLRALTSVWHWPGSELASQQPFYVQKETRSNFTSNKWRVERQAGWRTPMFEHLRHLAALGLPDTSVNETFERIDV